MIDSLFDLIIAVFIASLPLLIAIGRTRRGAASRRGSGSSDGGTAAEGARASGSTPAAPSGGDPLSRASGEKRERPRRRPGRELLRRLWHGSSAAPREGAPDSGRDGAPGTAESRPTAARARAEGAYEESRFPEGSEEEIEPTRPSGAEALMSRVNRYPPLQRAIVLKEILDKPKGVE